MQKCSCEKKQTYPREKKTRKAETTNTPANYHSSSSLYSLYKFIYDQTQRKHGQQQEQQQEQEQEQHSELFKCDQRYVSTFRRRVLLETRRAVAAAKARAVFVAGMITQSLGHHHHHHRRGGILRGGGGERNFRRRRPQILTMRRRRSLRKIR